MQPATYHQKSFGDASTASLCRFPNGCEVLFDQKSSQLFWRPLRERLFSSPRARRAFFGRDSLMIPAAGSDHGLYTSCKNGVVRIFADCSQTLLIHPRLASGRNKKEFAVASQ